MTEFVADIIAGKQDLDESLYAYFSSVDVPRLQLIKKRIAQVRELKGKGTPTEKKSFRGKQSKHVGLLLERLMQQLLTGCKFVDVFTNVHSSMAEIDYLIELSPSARVLAMFNGAGTHAIGEAKCTLGPLKTEWVNELVGVLSAHHANFGILFTASPSKKLQAQCRTAIGVHAAKGMKVVPFGMKQLDEVIAGENFLKVLKRQYVHVVTFSTDLAI